MNESIQLIMLFISLGEENVRTVFFEHETKTEDMNIKHAPGTKPHNKFVKYAYCDCIDATTVTPNIALIYFFSLPLVLWSA